MMNNSPFHSPRLMSRRQFLWQSGGGLGGIALSALLGQEGELVITTLDKEALPLIR